MNYRFVSKTLGRILLIGAAMLALPLILSVVYNDGMLVPFLISELVLAGLGSLLMLVRSPSGEYYSREGFIIVALSWILMSAIGALPFVLSGAVPDYVSAFFETVSGFTTSGATILTDIEALPKSLLFWRSFTHWIGGMGILVFMLAVMPKSNARMMHIMKAEVPGPKVDKLVSSTRRTAQILYLIYIALSVFETVALLCGGASLFDSLTVTFSTAGTGGFASYNSSIGAFNSLYVEIVVIVFMLLFSINFNLFYLAVLGQIRRALKSEELRWFFGIVIGATLLIAGNLYLTYGDIGSALRYSSFTVASITSTTGFVTANFTEWPMFSQSVIFVLMFVGAMAGSTGGGLKISRVMILLKSGIREIRRLLNPKKVLAVRIDKKPVDDQVLTGTYGFFCLYVLIIMVSTVLVTITAQQNDLITNFTSVVTAINNVGPTLGSIIGATGNFAGYDSFAKLVFCFCMLAGRLNLFPVVILFTPAV